MTYTAKLSNSLVDLYVTVDDVDAHLLQGVKWQGFLSHNTFYACRTVTENGKRRTLYLHRVIMNAPTGVKVDHKDGNGLNCVRSNMRTATDSQSAANTRRTDNKTGYRGVNRKGASYYAQIRVSGKLTHI